MPRLEIVVAELEKYSTEHFKHEERIFGELNYSGAAEHIQQHQTFIEKIADFNQLVFFEAGNSQDTPSEQELIIASNIVRFLFDWLVNHILSEDKKYSGLFIEKGVL